MPKYALLCYIGFIKPIGGVPIHPLRKKLSGDERFPFDLVYKDTKQPQNELPDHFHDWHELVFVYKGKGTLFVNQTIYNMGQGDLFLIPGNTIHSAFPDSETPVTSTAVFFSDKLIRRVELDGSYSLLRCFEHAKKKNSYKLETSVEERARLETLIRDMHTEQQTQKPGFRQSILIHLQLLLLIINRMAVSVPAISTGNSESEPLWMKETLLFIDRNLGAQLRLAALCRRAAVTPSHFSRVFKRLTGMNVTDYVIAKRIVYAKELLVRTDENMNRIATVCGFESASYFYKMFKKLTGMTPLAYKRNQRI